MSNVKIEDLQKVSADHETRLQALEKAAGLSTAAPVKDAVKAKGGKK